VPDERRDGAQVRAGVDGAGRPLCGEVGHPRPLAGRHHRVVDRVVRDRSAVPEPEQPAAVPDAEPVHIGVDFGGEPARDRHRPAGRPGLQLVEIRAAAGLADDALP
jgi:hypothetical protein